MSKIDIDSRVQINNKLSPHHKELATVMVSGPLASKVQLDKSLGESWWESFWNDQLIILTPGEEVRRQRTAANEYIDRKSEVAV